MPSGIYKRKPLTEETKRKISEAHKKLKGNWTFQKGHKPTLETCKKISKALTGKKLSEEHIKNISKGHLGQKAWNKGKKLPNQSGNKHGGWKGGKLKIDGYNVLYQCPGKYIREHHLVWLKANQLYRIPKGCVIHHCNGIKDDNRIGNLQLMTRPEHAKLHKEVIYV